MKPSLRMLAFVLLIAQNLYSQSLTFSKLPKQPDGSLLVTEIMGDLNGNIYAFTTDNYFWPSAFFYRSQDGGNSWQKINHSIPSPILAPDGNLYYASNGKFYRSTNQGQSWVTILQASWISPSNCLPKVSQANTLLLSDPFNNVLHRSTNQGTTWSQVSLPLAANENVDFFVTLPSGGIYLFASKPVGDYYHSVVYQSLDDGLTWQQKGTIAKSIYQGKILETPTGRLLLYDVTFGYFYRSDDEGSTWVELNLNWAGAELFNSIVQQPNGELWATTTAPRRWHSTDNGTTWSVVNPYGGGIYFYDVLTGIWRLPDGTVFGSFGGAIYKAIDETLNSWTISSSGMQEPNIVDFKVEDDSHITTLTTGGIFQTSDGGSTWSHPYQEPILKDNSYQGRDRFCFDDNGDILLADGYLLWRINLSTGARTNITPPQVNSLEDGILSISKLGNGVFMTSREYYGTFLSNDGGNTWSEMDPPFDFTTVTQAHPINDSLYLLEVDFGDFLWYNSFTNDHAPLVLPEHQYNSLLDVYIDANNTIHVISLSNPEYCFSHDFGASWECTDVDNSGPHTLGALAVNTNGTIFDADRYGFGIFESVDEGHSWNNIFETDILYSAETQGFSLSPTQRLYFSVYGEGLYRSNQPTTDQPRLAGKVFNDLDPSNCELDAQEPVMVKVKTRVDGAGINYVGVSNINGDYIMPATIGDLTAKAVPPSEYWEACEQQIAIANTGELVSDVNLGLDAVVQCPKLEVNIATPYLRRCFESTVYVEYCNTGTLPATGATVDVLLDGYLEYLSADAPLLVQNGQLLTFQIGDVPVNGCGKIKMQVNVSCNAELGQTHCTTAHIYPDDDCLKVWAGPWLEANAVCDGVGYKFIVVNKGAAMTTPTTYAITQMNADSLFGYEIIEEGQVLLGAGEQMDITATGLQGLTFFSVAQPLAFPYENASKLFISGCGMGQSPIGLFRFNDDFDWDYVLCESNQGSFDPNDKSASPPGLGSGDYLDTNDEIEYQIRFQNTGTDTAFHVVVKDLLSPYLDMASIRPIASSHSYLWEINERELVFRFSNIMLPDSNINEPGSHGFIRFAAKLHPDAPLGADLDNKAAIYFDFNDPVWTNTAHYTIGIPQPSATQEIEAPTLTLYPNPSFGQLLIEMPKWGSNGSYSVQIQDALGKTVHKSPISSQAISKLNLKWLAAGVYIITAKNEAGLPLATGRWVKL
jgi:uncharacterized repeat protein (TIGR01451 family)